MELEPGTWTYRVERSTAEPKNGDARKHPRTGMIMFHPRKMYSMQRETQKQGHEKLPGREMPPEMKENPRLPDIPSVPGDRASRPRENVFLLSPLAEFGGNTRFFTGNTDGCCGGGGVAPPCGRGWFGGGRESRCRARHTKTE